MNVKRAICNSISVLREQGLGAALHWLLERVSVRWFEWRFGINSEAIIALKELGIENDLSRPYVATDYRTFQKVLKSLQIRHGEDSFLDFGSGLGRAVIMAAMCPFRRVIGVEIAEQLNEVARENVRKASPSLKCRDIEIVTADATRFAIPPDVTIIYFFNPFCGDILAEVLENIRASLRQHPRALQLICKVPAESAFELEIDRHAWIAKEREMVFTANSRYLFLAVHV